MTDFQQLVDTTKAEFVKRFGCEPQWIVASPGRVNLIGEHTDYNDGFVFPMAIERYTVIAAGPLDGGDGRKATVYSMTNGEEAEILIDGSATPPGKVVWSSYVQGTVQNAVQAAFNDELGLNPFRAIINSNVPLGGGLSSSASLEVATATLTEQIVGRKFDPVEKALLCQKAEHEYAKMPCGIMDQFISTLGEKGHAMLLDCRSRVPKMVPLDDPVVSVLIINSNVKHELTGSEYPDRRRQCEKAARLLGVSMLRDATMPMLEKAKEIFNKEDDGDLCFRRARHVITEDDRTVAMAEALQRKDWTTCGKLMYASHDSMRDDFEITCPEIDALVEIAKTVDGVVGSRMTGGGFGGCTVSLVETTKVAAISKAISEQYKTKTGIEATIFATRPAQGAMVLS